MRRILPIAVLLGVLVVLGIAYLSRYDDVEQLEIRITANIRTDHVDRIWYSPAGELVGIGLNDSNLLVRVWSDSAGKLIRERTVALPSKGVDKPIFAVSGDALWAAWIDPAGVQIASLTLPARKNTSSPLSRRIPVSSLAFTAPGRLATLYRDGEVELRDTAGDRVAAATHLDIADPGILTSSGSYLAVWSSASGNAFVFDTAGDRFSLIEHKKYSRDITSLTLSPLARFAVATHEAIEHPGRSIPTPGPVRGLAFYDRNRVLAAGDFPGVYLLGADRGPQQVASALPGTTVLDATESHFAFGNGNNLVLAAHRTVKVRVYKGVGRPSPWLLAGLLGTLAAILIYLFYGNIGAIFRKIFNIKPAEPEQAVKPLDEGPIPNALVEACRNGECVLWAGSGLSAQAGLPTWSAFLKELVEWAAQNDAGVISEDQPGKVADRIAAAFETREQVLNAYLRQRFRVYAELSEAHRLIKAIDFQALVTTNLDTLLERTFPHSGGRVYTAAKYEDLARTSIRRDFFLLKPYGDIEEPDTICLGPAQCAQAAGRYPAFPEFTAELFSNRVFLFIGASQEGLERELASLDLPTPTARKHYALIPMIDDWEARSERLRKIYAIEPLPYPNVTAEHREVVEFLAQLLHLVQEKNTNTEYLGAAE